MNTIRVFNRDIPLRETGFPQGWPLHITGINLGIDSYYQGRVRDIITKRYIQFV